MNEKNNLINYKGIYYQADTEKYSCPTTGAHFKFTELCALLEPIRITRGDPFCLQFSPKNTAQSVLPKAIKKLIKNEASSRQSENFIEDTIDELY